MKADMAVADLERDGKNVLRVKNLTVHYRTAAGLLEAVAGVSFTLAPGEILGLVGESGCGKSSLALAMLGLLEENAMVSGQAVLDGRELPLGQQGGGRAWREIRGGLLAYVPQDPLTGLNPVLKVGFQLEEAVSARGKLSRHDCRERALELLGRVKIPAPGQACRSYPHQLSGGQRQRVLLAMAMAGRPRVLVADEPTTALDVTTQAGIMREIRAMAADAGSAVLFISHDLGVVAGLARRVAVMYAGGVVEEGPARELFSAPAHPYTRALLTSIPRLNGRRRLEPVAGQPPSLAGLPEGCVFHPRCPLAAEKCRSVKPRLSAFSGDRAAACHLPPI
jgi:oligopeptide/dipeptide ABC transporter ATP-binding protein